MSQNRRYPYLGVVVSLILVMALRILPLPVPWSAVNPDWIALALFFWALTTNGTVGVGSAWLVGLITDMLTGRLLGQYALAYAVATYLAIRWGRQIMLQTRVQQTLSIVGLLLTTQLLVLWTQRVEPDDHMRGIYWLASLFGALFWPLLSLLMKKLGRLSDVGPA
jgi:rod shape-determining protein MreD